MSNRYKGGIISATPPTLVAGAGASGAWTLEQQMQATAAGLWPVNGPFYIEDMFQTWLYTGNGTTQTINNGIDLAGKGGMVWGKNRSAAANNFLANTVLGASNGLISNSTGGNTFDPDRLTAFTASGFSVGSSGSLNTSGNNYASWTFREQPKFFDVVTWSGNDTTRSIPHNLGAVPGCMIIKATNSAKDWYVYHRGMDATAPEDYYQVLNTTAARVLNGNLWDAPTSTHIVLNTAGGVNQSGVDYVAYLFAHNAGGFGLTGTDNVISCGSYTGTGTAGLNVTLGYEPQWVMVKNATTGGYNWLMFDTMRSMSNTGSRYLLADSSSAEGNAGLATVVPTATGFTIAVDSSWSELNNSGNTYIYIAIRRGPMRVPTDGTKVFSPNTTSNDSIPITTNFPVDMILDNLRAGNALNTMTVDRLRGTKYLSTSSTAAEASIGSFAARFTSNTSVTPNVYADTGPEVVYSFGRAPGFFDEVCYTGDATDPRTINHNLGVAPELIITKQRSSARSWPVRITALGNSVRAFLNLTDAAAASSSVFPVATYTGSTYVIGSDASVNASGGTYVAYLFASAPGVSKVGSYTGTGTTQTINCGFTGGARFVLIKRTDSTGDWFVWDTARGMIPANDPYLLLNSTAAEVTGTDFVDTAATGFEITSTAPAAINANGGTFIFLAIA